MFFLLAAFAEPPLYVPLADDLSASDIVVVARAVRHEYQTLEPGQSVKRTSFQRPWTEYQVSRIVSGDGLAGGDVVRVRFSAAGCERVDLELERVGDHVVQRILGTGSEQQLDPGVWLPSEPQVLLLDLDPSTETNPVTAQNVGWHHSPLPATAERLAAVEDALRKRRRNGR